MIAPKKPTHLVRIEVRFVEQEDGEIKIITDDDESKSPKEEKETFSFKTPAWGDVKRIMSNCSIIAQDGQVSFDGYKFLDARMKGLLVAWSLKDEKENPLKVTEENIDKLPSTVVTYLNGKLDGIPAFATAFGG